MPLVPLHHDGDHAGVRGVAVLEEEEALPGAEGHAAIDDGDDFAGAGEAHADVGGHVIWSLIGVDEVGGVFWDEVVEEGFEIGAGAGVRIFHDDQAGAGVLDENGDGAGADARFRDDVRDLAGDLVGSLSGGPDGEAGRVVCHGYFPVFFGSTE